MTFSKETVSCIFPLMSLHEFVERDGTLVSLRLLLQRGQVTPVAVPLERLGPAGKKTAKSLKRSCLYFLVLNDTRKGWMIDAVDYALCCGMEETQ